MKDCYRVFETEFEKLQDELNRYASMGFRVIKIEFVGDKARVVVENYY